jgi:hypothetical protein
MLVLFGSNPAAISQTYRRYLLGVFRDRLPYRSNSTCAAAKIAASRHSRAPAVRCRTERWKRRSHVARAGPSQNQRFLAEKPAKFIAPRRRGFAMIRGGRCGTFRHGGRDVRLTDVSGEVINEILT